MGGREGGVLVHAVTQISPRRAVTFFLVASKKNNRDSSLVSPEALCEPGDSVDRCPQPPPRVALGQEQVQRVEEVQLETRLNIITLYEVNERVREKKS